MRRLLASALISLALISCTEGGPRKVSPTPTVSSPMSMPATGSPSPSPAAGGLAIIDSTWVSADDGWVLGRTTCGSAVCITLKATSDGGRTWREVTSPGGPPAADMLEECVAPCVTNVRFANRMIGYAFGPGFFVTRDGGRTWVSEPARLVFNVEISRGRAFRVVGHMTGCPGPCDVRMEVSDVGSRGWRELATPRLDAVRTELIAEGSRVYLAAHGNPAGGAEDAHTRYLRSLDAGRTWQRFDDPCGDDAGGENDGTAMAAAPGGVLSILCTSRMRPTQLNFVVTSTDDARSFGPRRQLPNAATIAISLGSARTIAVSAFRGAGPRLFVSHDGGRSWRVTLEAPVPADPEDSGFFLGFQNAATARAAFAGPSIWTTRDAGRTWRRSDPF